ncbi:MAG: PCRF domain-containing protein [Candidatus Portnoybacteria bacterium]|nr:PCRF domain-containing protein [Candidatus Portnoybacteria bacterium]
MVKSIILEIRAGAGGEEASLFAGDLLRMYQKYAQTQNWAFLLLDGHPSPLGGYKSLTAEIKGEDAYDQLQYESGVHRVQRIPKTEKSGRIHTSTASVAVLPKVEAVEVQINPNDLDYATFRSSGPGGQNVNKVETAVRLTHRPTGIVVECQIERSQARNRELAMDILRTKIYDIQRQRQQQEIAQERRDQIGSAMRAEKIRTYNYPQNRITDHRIGKSWHNLENIMEGKLDKMIKDLIKLIKLTK